jgi:16S rRNA (guanine(966)-N(2))-methyltransferase RsmD
MRVIAGSARSIPLIAPKGDKTRPTIDKHKETLFNCLTNSLYDCVFVDLYSGSGAIGIEALSRGAKKAYFVENNKEALACIRSNLAKTKLEDGAVVLSCDVSKALRVDIKEKADIIFMDPPFALHAKDEILKIIKEKDLLAEGGIVVVECEAAEDFTKIGESGFVITKEKNYKSCRHVFLRREEI